MTGDGSYQGENSGIPPLSLWFPYQASKPVRLLPPLVLAYIGDAVFEVAVRQYLISRPKLKPHHLHVQATRFVSAKSQAKLLALIGPQLTEEEQDVVRQGRNAKSGSVPKNADVIDYRHATAFEALVGFLYYSGRHERLQLLLDQGMKLLETEMRE
ncbi:Mini-ribonuclease 3 [Paenibacillus pinistramenti]|uniref:Mini-ribonuclease 3 n=1 Tax=Paenibacillus pinistramenti TaxID=1768003 RepID=UPI001108D45D|nr:Mini-ribonuclease 3 [Paenibacillus pinistramenti]